MTKNKVMTDKQKRFEETLIKQRVEENKIVEDMIEDAQITLEEMKKTIEDIHKINTNIENMLMEITGDISPDTETVSVNEIAKTVSKIIKDKKYTDKSGIISVDLPCVTSGRIKIHFKDKKRLSEFRDRLGDYKVFEGPHGPVNSKFYKSFFIVDNIECFALTDKISDKITDRYK